MTNADTPQLEERKPPRVTLDNKLHAYLARLREDRLGLPSRRISTTPGETAEIEIDAIDLVAVAIQISHQPARQLAEGSAKDILLAGAHELGLEYRGEGPANFVDLTARVLCTPLQSVLEKLLSFTCLELTDRLDQIFLPEAEFSDMRDAIVAADRASNAFENSSADDLDQLAAEARLLIDARYQELSFAECLREMIICSGLSMDSVAESAGTYSRALHGWIAGKQPRHQHMAVIERLEKILSLPAGSLRSRAVATHNRVSDPALTEKVREEFDDYGIPIAFLMDGDFAAWPMQQRIDWCYENFLNRTPFARYLRAGNDDPIRYADLSGPMEAEWKRLETFKTEENPDPEFPREVLIPIGKGLTKKLGGRWRPVSAELTLSYIKRMLFALLEFTAAYNGGGDWKDNSGLGFMAIAMGHKLSADGIAKRRYRLLKASEFFEETGCKEPASGMVFAYPDVSRLYILQGLFNPITGYLFHNPPKIVPIPGLITPEWILKATSNWPATMEKLNTALTAMITNISRAALVVRDPWLPIEKLLDLDEPMAPLYDALKAMAKNRPDHRGDLLAMARHDRDLVINGLIVHTKLRRKHFALFTWRADNTGSIRYVKERWRIVIDRIVLKNTNTTAVPGDGPLEIELDPEDPVLYDALQRWIGKPQVDGIEETGSSRRLMHGDNSGHWLFPGVVPGSAIVDNTVDDVFRTLIAIYVAECPWRGTGIKGVIIFGEHAVRDLAATQVLKKTGSYELAANAIYDTPDMVKKRYARLLSIEKSRVNNEFFRATKKPEAPQPNEPEIDPAC